MSLAVMKADVCLRPYQSRALERIEDARTRGVRRLLVVAPTGAGKTILIAELGRRFADGGVLVVAHRRELITQSYTKLLAAGLPESSVGVLMAHDGRRRPAAPVQVASIDTLRHRPKPPASVVIVDEAHRELSNSYVALREHYRSAFHLGFTATPYRADNRGLGEFYEELLIVATIGELIALGFLVEPRVFTVPEGDLPSLAGVRVRRGDYDARELESAVDQTRLVGNIVEHWQKRAAGLRTVAFAVSVKHSQHIVERFVASGIRAEHLDGTTPAHERDAILARLDRGETLVVSNCSVLAEGWDQPSVKCGILARPTESTGLYLQQAGRILRPFGDVGAIILDHAGCARAHQLPQHERQFSLDAKPKRKRTEADEVSIRVCDGCQAVLPGRIRVCPECGYVFVVAGRAVPDELAGELVELTASDAARSPPASRPPTKKAIREADALEGRRAAFEQMWALARGKRKTSDWAVERYAARYGAAPPDEWVESAWGAL
jgi:DNA repair protein RadD